MTDFVATSERFVQAYNDKDYDAFERMIAPDLDFEHFNRNFAFDNRDGLMGVIREFGENLMPDRTFHPPERVTAEGNTVVREARWTGTPNVDTPFGPAGEAIAVRFCSVLRFDDDGVLVEWKDYG